MKSEYEPLAKALTSARGASHVIFTSELRSKYSGPLDSLTASEDELRDYYNEFNATDEPEAGKPMLDGVKALRDALLHADDSSVVLSQFSKETVADTTQAAVTRSGNSSTSVVVAVENGYKEL